MKFSAKLPFLIWLVMFISPAQSIDEKDIVATVSFGTEDLGKIVKGGTHPVSWTVENNGKSPMVLQSLKAGCNCMEVSIDHKTIPPGQKGTITGKVRTLSQPQGNVRWKVRADFGRDGKPVGFELCATAEIVGGITCEPNQIGFRGTGPASISLSVRDSRKPGIEVMNVTTNLSGLKVQIEKKGPGDNLIRVIKAEGTVGKQLGFIIVETDDSAHPHLEIPVQIDQTTTQLVEASPSQIQFSAKRNCKVILSRPGDLLVRVSKINTPGGLSAKLTKGPGPKATIDFQQMGTIAAGEKVLIEFENKQVPPIELEITWK